ncbi:MAG TPA: hypothetical protein PKD85_13890, partial [Saprospiraceae bacterium]|nr:hypothetical protein [Saprospiraceae bacterium]
MKKILKFLGFTVVGILLAMVLLPIVYKDKIVALIKETINDELNAVVEFDDVSLSLFKSFPNARLTITDFSITGIDTFENIDLIKAKSLYVVSDISPLFKKDQKPSIKYLAISDANFNILKLDSQYANYLITKESEDTSGFNLVLDGYELNNTTITYHDKSLQLLLEAVGLSHKGKGNLSSDVFSLDTKTTADALTVRYENFTYLKEVKTIADLVLQIDLTNEKYSFDNGAVTLNKLSLTGKGTIDFNGDDMYINTELSSLDQTFQNFVTALPFIENNKAYTAKGSADIRLKANGIYNSVKSTYPAFDVLMKVSDGFLQYQGFDYAVSPINANLSVNAKDPQLKDLSIHIPKFNIGINKEKIAGELKIDKASTNPALKGHIKGSLSLENWIKALPMEGIEELSGKILSDISF